MPETEHVLLTTLERVERSRDELAQLREMARLEEARRNELIVQGYDEGIALRAIARAAGVAHSRVPVIVAQAGSEE